MLFPKGRPFVTDAPPSTGGAFKWFTDDLTLRDSSGRIRWTCSHAFQQASVRQENIELLRDRRYNMSFVDQLNYVTKSEAIEDGVKNPALLVDACRELQAAGIKAVPRFGYEDAHSDLDRRNLLREVGGIEGYIPRLNVTAHMLAPHVDGWCIGKESFEAFSPGEVELIARTLAVHGLPIAVHLGQGEFGPDGNELVWWARLRRSTGRCPIALAYQATHPRVEDGGGAFTSDADTVRLQVSSLVSKFKTLDIKVMLAEHSYNGSSLDAQIVTEAQSQALGDVGLRAGAVSTQNGCTPEGMAVAT